MSDTNVVQDSGQQVNSIQDITLLDQIVEATKVTPDNQAFPIMKSGVEALIRDLVKPEYRGVKINGDLVDAIIGEIDEQMSLQVDEILHDPNFLKIESTWRGLQFLVERTDFKENIRLEMMNLSKQDLYEDFEDSPEIVKSGLYQLAYTKEYGQFGGQPYGAIIADYEFGPGSQDMKLLSDIAAVCTMSHSPFIAAAGREFFGIDNWKNLPSLKDLRSVFEGPQYQKWNSFRESEDARHIGLTLPRFLLRQPYGGDGKICKLFNYKEQVNNNDDNFCWGNTAFAFATRLAASFADYRWCANIIGPQSGGMVDDLATYQFHSQGEVKSQIPTEILLSERREYELSEEGFIGLTMRKGSDNAAFFSANSCQKPKTFSGPGAKEAELNYKLSTQLPYMLVMDRLAHYIKVLQRENIGSWKEKQDLERELNNWISQYVTEMDNPQPGVRSKHPLRGAQIAVNDVEGDPGWYQVSLKARPHFKYMGASFTLSLVGKLDKE
ncbi:type VI secretion system contractile sheath large subunit [Grimontia sp. SpTr1]|uniref:type VI secretion system contractile sheath large subunit n=1 Tax=Grimontia sp. SpTr1 TaxID=2995319 RepID=UPI00248C68CC|nr:type VI secretion system contractile sheath large subunit [Grimontia sp. SpTr1]